eukprot:2297498-Ditylum_brightwellii.AAC.1
MKGISEATSVGGQCLTVSALKQLVLLVHDAHEGDAPKTLTTARRSTSTRAFMGESGRRRLQRQHTCQHL